MWICDQQHLKNRISSWWNIIRDRTFFFFAKSGFKSGEKYCISIVHNTEIRNVSVYGLFLCPNGGSIVLEQVVSHGNLMLWAVIGWKL